MGNMILTPPVVFAIVLAVVALLSYLATFLAFKKKGAGSSTLPYACGEESYDEYAQPDYSQFFPFAFFFTIAHVATLILATIPFVTFNVFVIAVIYIMAVLVGLFILLWR